MPHPLQKKAYLTSEKLDPSEESGNEDEERKTKVIEDAHKVQPLIQRKENASNPASR